MSNYTEHMRLLIKLSSTALSFYPPMEGTKDLLRLPP